LAEDNSEIKGGVIRLKLLTGTVAANTAVKMLRDDIIDLHENPNYLSFWMGVNLKTAEADLVPIVTPANMEKLSKNYDNLPENIRKVIENSMPKERIAAARTIWDALSKQKALEEADSDG
jgi:hypothetical protein